MWEMNRLQGAAIGFMLLAMGVTAFLQIMDVDHVMRILSIAALGTISILAAMVFFVFAFKEEATSNPPKLHKRSELRQHR